MYPQVLFQNRHPDRAATLEEYQKNGGYQSLELVLKKYSLREVKQKILDSGLRGRGGAGFLAGRKWMSVAEDGPIPRYLVANTDEMEPGTFKDRVLIHVDPHQVIEGMIIAGYAVWAEKGFIFVRPSYEAGSQILERELEIAKQAGYLGKNILGTDYSLEIVVHRSGGRYICGEASAQINAIQGSRAHPMKGPHLTEQGLWGQPTVVNNVETLACVPHILRHDASWFRGLARSKSGAGTKLYGVSGKICQPGCYELPIGTPLNEIIEVSAGGMTPGSEFKACLPGGASTRYLPKQFYDVEMDFDPLGDIGHRLGTGAIVVFDQKTCLVGATLNMIEFFARESCGWCTPCREGLPYIRDLLWRIEHGEGKEEYIPMLCSMSAHMNQSYCAFAPGAVASVESLTTYFRDELCEHISQRKCPFEN